MISVEHAVASYKRSVERADLGSHPVLWVGYWRDDTPLGYIYAAKLSLSMSLWLTSPFVMTKEVDTMFVVVDQLSVLRVCRLREGQVAHWITSWTVPYSVDDRGRLRFGAGYEDRPLPLIDRVIRFVSAQRANTDQRWTWDEAFAAAVEVARRE